MGGGGLDSKERPERKERGGQAEGNNNPPGMCDQPACLVLGVLLSGNGRLEDGRVVTGKNECLALEGFSFLSAKRYLFFLSQRNGTLHLSLKM